jgi:hypothetical protein
MKLKPWQMWALLILLVILIARDGYAIGHFLHNFLQGLNGLSAGMNGG